MKHASAQPAPSKQTSPGPWRTGPINYSDVYDANGELVALVPKGLPTTAGNGLLIAVAPDHALVARLLASGYIKWEKETGWLWQG